MESNLPQPRLKILIVDDHAEFRRTLRQMFEHEAVSVIEADSGEEAVRLFQVEHPDSVVMDIRMPGMDGFQATRAIRHLDPGARVFVMSQFSETGQEGRVHAAGATDFLDKHDMLRLVETVCGHARQK